LRTRLTK